MYFCNFVPFQNWMVIKIMIFASGSSTPFGWSVEFLPLQEPFFYDIAFAFHIWRLPKMGKNWQTKSQNPWQSIYSRSGAFQTCTPKSSISRSHLPYSGTIINHHKPLSTIINTPFFFFGVNAFSDGRPSENSKKSHGIFQRQPKTRGVSGLGFPAIALLQAPRLARLFQGLSWSAWNQLERMDDLPTKWFIVSWFIWWFMVIYSDLWWFIVNCSDL